MSDSPSGFEQRLLPLPFHQRRVRIASYRAPFWGLLLRDARVLRREFAQFFLRAVMQPFLFVLVFLYVFPHIGAGIHGPGRASFGTILLPGLVAVAILFQGIQAVALPLVNEINRTREIEDRVMAPLPTNLVAFEKIVFGALQSALAAMIVFPMVLWFPDSHVHTNINPGLLVAEIAVACFAAAALGLTIGTSWNPRQVPLIFSVIVEELSMSMKSKTLAEEGTPTYLESGDPARSAPTACGPGRPSRSTTTIRPGWTAWPTTSPWRARR